MIFYKLKDDVNAGDVVRAEGRKHYTYSFGAYRWVRTTMMMSYMNPDSPLYGKYEEISEDEAQSLVVEKGKHLNHLQQKAEELIENHKSQMPDEDGLSYIDHMKSVIALLDDQECRITAWLKDICTCSEITLDDLKKEGFTPRIVQAVKVLVSNRGTSDAELDKIRKNIIAREVKSADIDCRLNINRYSQVDPDLERRLDKLRDVLKYLQRENS